MMDPFTLALIVSVFLVGYGTAAPDSKTLRATRGAAGAARAAGSGARGHVKAQRAKSAPARAQARDARHAKLAASGRAGRARVRAERAAHKTAHGIAEAARAGVAAAKAAPSGYTPAAEAAVQRREAKRAQKREAREKRRAEREARFVMAQTPDTTEPTTPDPTPTQEETVTIPSYAVRTSDLTSLDVLRAEVSKVLDQTREALDAEHCLRTYGNSLLERYAEAEFGTRPIAAAVGDVHENTPKASSLLAFEESLAGLLKAIDAAQEIAEAVTAQGASGKTEAFVSA